jgi:hypothetical protein
MAYLKDLIDLPDQVRQGDFVLRLTESLGNPEQTLENYVVTPELAKCFRQALDLVKSSLQSHSSKGAYLHGSFGSGKSHFMAVLNLMLANHPAIQKFAEFPSLLAETNWNDWGHGKKFLLVPFHMIGKTDLTSAILEGYTDFVTRLHPDKPHPGVYRSEKLIENARNLRKQMGDDAFFAALNGELAEDDDEGLATAREPILVSDGGGWGLLGSAWDAASFDRAANAHPKDPERVRLVGSLVATIFSHAHGTAEYIDLDNGLSVISNHAKFLGYDAIILFLDELILWLASHAGKPEFVTQQGQLLAKLVESQNAKRDVPLISFIARQKSLRELVGDTMLGAQYVSLDDSIKHFDQRFDVIKLEDRNLPTIAQKRVLKPRSEAARQQIDEAFRQTEKLRRDVLDVLQTKEGDRNQFRKIYPFSPALMETLVALSTLLQRERTALKIMLMLLVEQKETLELGQIIPVGDIFDIIMKGEEPFSDVIRVHFENARRLYLQQLLPLIEAKNGIRKEQADAGSPTDPKVMGFCRDDRLAKTLLLSALAPEVESFRAMTVNKLAALNHGSIKTPIPGGEGRVVLQKCREWAAEIGQIRIGDEEGNPTVSVQLAGVDTDSLVGQAATEDNAGNRIRKVKELVYEMMGLELADALWISHDFLWRGTKRQCQFLFANVRELNTETLNNQTDDWKVIIDFPFDKDENHGPRDDLAKIDGFRRAFPMGSRTIAWVPSFLNNSAQRELGLLVKLDHVLTGSRFETYAARLSAVERTQAKVILENQGRALRQKIKGYLEAAYGLATDKACLDSAHTLDPDEQILSLHPNIAIPVPSAATLKDAAQEVLHEALKGQFPGHPEFATDTRISGASVKRVWLELEKALQSADGRSPVDPTNRRDVKLIAEPLKLATMGETHLVVDGHWRQHFAPKEGSEGATTVGKIRRWIDEPQPMGLPAELQNLIILFFATQADRSLTLHGGPVQASLEMLRDEMELRSQPLPSAAQWKEACSRAQGIFGLTPGSICNASNVARLTADLKAKALEFQSGAQALVAELEQRLQQRGIAASSSERLATACAGRDLLEAIRSATETQVIAALAAAPWTQLPLVLGTSIRQAVAASTALQRTKWNIIDSASRLTDYRQAAGAAITSRVQEVLSRNEQDVALPGTLARIEDDAATLLADRPPTPPAPVPGPVTPGATPAPTPGASVPVVPPSPTPTPAGNPPASPLPVAGASWHRSDATEVEHLYANQPDLVARNRRLVTELKSLYGASQVAGDQLPPGLPQAQVVEVLEVHHIRPLSKGGADERSNMIVVTASLHALIHADAACHIDLGQRTMVLFGVRLALDVKPNHKG